MKIGQTNLLRGTGRTGRRDGSAGPASAGVVETHRTEDSASIMGIPEPELTPKVRAAIEGLMEEVGRLRQEVEQTRKRVNYLERLADQDSLVPVINRRAFVRELSRMLSFAERYNSVSSVLFFDINKMKVINDSYGHAAGDAALSHVCSILLESVRESDIIGRLGGDEFGVILAQTDEDQAKEKAALLATAIRDKPLMWDGKEVDLSLSCGAYTFRGGEDVSDALHAADRAMYQNKQSADGG